MMSRSVVLTGDDFQHVRCQPGLSGDSSSGCGCTGERQWCTLGLHAVMVGGGVLRVQHARVEKCGQRGVKGKYW